LGGGSKKVPIKTIENPTIVNSDPLASTVSNIPSSFFGGGGTSTGGLGIIQDKRQLVQEFLSDSLRYLFDSAQYNAEFKFNREKGIRTANRHYTQNDIALNKLYAKPRFNNNEGGILDNNMVRGNRALLNLVNKTTGKDFGKTAVVYQIGERINGFNANRGSTPTDLQNGMVGLPFKFYK